jgi:peptide/nickel transport system substrate-binding protein
MALAATACGTNGGSTSAGGGEASSAPVSGGTIVAALSGDPQTLDVAQNSGALTIYVGQSIFEQLFTADKTFTPRPMLAQDATKSDDGLTYTIKLRSGIKFHNGQPMTAADVVASLERWEKVSGGGKLVAADVASLTATDDQTVQIVLNKPRYSLLSDLAGNIQGAIIVPADIAKAAGTQPMGDDKIIGTGPYKLASFTHGQSVVLEKNPDYVSRDETDWGGYAGAKKAYVDKIDFRFVPDATQQLNGLKTGQFQWAQAVSADQYDVIKDDPALNVQKSETGLVNTVLLNHNAASPFSQLPARQAMNAVIDKEAMATAAFGPKDLWQLKGSMVLDVDKPLYSDAGTDVYETYDLNKAKDLFAQAGVTADKPIRIATTQTYPKFYQMAVIMQAQLEKVGLKAEVDVFDFPTMIDRLTSAPTSWDISMTGFGGNVGSPSQILYLTPTWPGEYRSEKMSALLAQYNQSKNADEAAKVVQQIQQTIWDEIPVIAIAPNRNLLVSSSKLKGLSNFNQAIFWNSYLAQ